MKAFDSPVAWKCLKLSSKGKTGPRGYTAALPATFGSRPAIFVERDSWPASFVKSKWLASQKRWPAGHLVLQAPDF